MALNHTITISWTNGNSVPTRTLVYTVDTEYSMDTGLAVSGHVQALVNDPLPPVVNWSDLHISFAGNARLQTHLSGSYLSGGVGTTLYINSGKPIVWWAQTSGMQNPFFPVNAATPATGSGTITAVSLMSTQSGLFSGTFRVGFSGTIVSG